MDRIGSFYQSEINRTNKMQQEYLRGYTENNYKNFWEGAKGNMKSGVKIPIKEIKWLVLTPNQ